MIQQATTTEPCIWKDGECQTRKRLRRAVNDSANTRNAALYSGAVRLLASHHCEPIPEPDPVTLDDHMAIIDARIDHAYEVLRAAMKAEDNTYDRAYAIARDRVRDAVRELADGVKRTEPKKLIDYLEAR